MDLLALQSAEGMTTAQAKARADLAGKERKVQQFLNEKTGEISKFFVGTPGYKRAMADDNLALTGNATFNKDETDKVPKIQNFVENSTGVVIGFPEGSIRYDEAVNNPELYTATGDLSQTKTGSKTADLITLYNPVTKDEINIRKDQVGEIDRLQTEGYRKRTTPSIDDGSKPRSTTLLNFFK